MVVHGLGEGRDLEVAFHDHVVVHDGLGVAFHSQVEVHDGLVVVLHDERLLEGEVHEVGVRA